MTYQLDDPQTVRALNHLRRCMNKFDFGSKEYNLARKAFAYLANKIRANQKMNYGK